MGHFDSKHAPAVPANPIIDAICVRAPAVQSDIVVAAGAVGGIHEDTARILFEQLGDTHLWFRFA